MTNTRQHTMEILQDRFGLRVAARLDAGSQDLSHDIAERLRAARMQALDKRKLARVAVAPAVLAAGGGAAVMGFGDDNVRWWNRLAAALPLLVLVVGLFAINAAQNDRIAKELAVVDAALLVDDLPPAAYTDPGFAQFVKVGNDTTTP